MPGFQHHAVVGELIQHHAVESSATIRVYTLRIRAIIWKIYSASIPTAT